MGLRHPLQRNLGGFVITAIGRGEVNLRTIDQQPRQEALLAGADA